jgi:hypothetical protein
VPGSLLPSKTSVTIRRLTPFRPHRFGFGVTGRQAVQGPRFRSGVLRFGSKLLPLVTPSLTVSASREHPLFPTAVIHPCFVTIPDPASRSQRCVCGKSTQRAQRRALPPFPSLCADGSWIKGDRAFHNLWESSQSAGIQPLTESKVPGIMISHLAKVSLIRMQPILFSPGSEDPTANKTVE